MSDKVQSTADADHYLRLVGVFHASPTNDHAHTTIDITNGRAILKREVGTELHHAAGAVHGAHLFKLLDDAAFFAANSQVPDVFVLTVTFTVQFMRPVTVGEVTAKGRVVRVSRRVIWAESEIIDSDGKIVATGSGTFLKSAIGLTPEIGYA